MSIGSLGAIGSFAAAPASQRTSDVDKTQSEASDKARVDDAAEFAEQAAGIGETREESGASDRDADGRKIWERSEPKKSPDNPAEDPLLPPARDPTGVSGNQLDLLG